MRPYSLFSDCSSEENSKIDLLDPPEVVRRKIAGAGCPRETADNGVLAFYQNVLLPILGAEGVTINQKFESFHFKVHKFRTFTEFEPLRDEFLGGKLSEEHLKDYLIDFLNRLLADVQQR